MLAVAVNADEGVDVASESSKRLGLTMMVGLNEPALYRTLGVRTLPTLLVIDKQGRMRARWSGYRPGLEKEIAAIVDKLLAGDESGTTRELAMVISGDGQLQARWSRELPGSADGVIGMPAGIDGGARVVASSGDELLSFDAAGDAVARLKVTKATGKLLDFGVTKDGAREIVGYRPGATTVGVIALRSGSERAISVPAPLLDLVRGAGDGAERRLVVATMRGAAQAMAGDDRAKLLDGREGVRSVAVNPARAVVVLRDDGTIAALEAKTTGKTPVAAGADRLLAALADGAVVGPRSTIAAVSGKFLAGEGRQLAIATYASRLVLLDEASGRVVYEASWTGIRDLAVTDLDGDGRDELLVASGRAVTALGAATH